VLPSIIAAETSAGTFFGTPGEGYALRNFTYIQLAFGTILARILVSFIFIKPYYDYQVFSFTNTSPRASRRATKKTPASAVSCLRGCLHLVRGCLPRPSFGASPGHRDRL